MKFEQILHHRYTIAGRLPACSATHQRYELLSAGGTGDRFVLSFCDYAKAISTKAVARQQQVGEALVHPSAALLCRAIECRFEPDFQAVISEFPGEVSLREVLQEQQSLELEEVEAFLRLVTDAAESAVRQGWPKLMLDVAHLYLNERLGLPRVPVPDMPIFDAVGSELPGFDPMQTMQFNTADLKQSADPIPKDSREYVPALAALACDLLGQPRTLRGHNMRYQPVPQFTSQQNIHLRRALTGEARAGFASARNFTEELFGSPMQLDIATQTERLRSLALTASKTELRAAAPAFDPALTVRLPLPSAAATAESAKAPLVVHQSDAVAVATLPSAQRLRLMPEVEEAPVFSLAAVEWLLLGRSAGDSDFVAQFRPRSSAADGRTRRISRVQARVRVTGSRIELEETDMLNPSTYRDTPVGAGLMLDSPTFMLLAGEYPVELHRVKLDDQSPRVFADRLDWNESAEPQGALVARPGGPGVMLWEAALVLSDVGLHFSQSGRPWLQVDNSDSAAARLHYLQGQFWLEPIEAGAIKCADSSTPRAHDLILLRAGLKFYIGKYAYTVQPVTLGESG
ncbi:MAG: hypothetical protein K8R87_14560 [Verrucomicrobia bacterium]|nr:hypothetical protein [Verrucomicrobiota bacterium]